MGRPVAHDPLRHAPQRVLSSLEERGLPIRGTLRRVEGRYGSVGSYLEENGVTRPEIDRVRARIRPKAARDGDREG